MQKIGFCPAAIETKIFEKFFCVSSMIGTFMNNKPQFSIIKLFYSIYLFFYKKPPIFYLIDAKIGPQIDFNPDI